MERKTGKRSPKSRQIEAKVLFTTLSITVTLGAWQAFAKQEAIHARLEAAAGQPAQVLQDAAPLPTLFPPLPGQPISGLQAQTSPEQPTRLLLGGAKPQAPRPAPVARTGSSR